MNGGEQITEAGRTNGIEALRAAARPLGGSAQDYDPLLELIGDARFVLLGAASHGTHEFYRERAVITKRLIEERSFTAVAVEADWPDAYRVDRYVRGAGEDAGAVEALAGFRRFPIWLWRNTDAVEWIDWLRGHNDELPEGAAKVGFYGLDLYSLRASRQAVLQYLLKVDPKAADRARAQYACLDHFGDNARGYGVFGGIGRPCRDAAVAGLVELQQSRAVRPGAQRRSRRGGGVFQRAAERARGAKRRGRLRLHVPKSGAGMEPARAAHGGDARRSGRAPRPARRARQGRRVGA